MRTVEWNYQNNKLRLIDQRALPVEFILLEYDRYDDVATAIRDMVVRGAPAIGVTAAFAMGLAGFQSSTTNTEELIEFYTQAAVTIKAARPTAVNLSWAVDKVLGLIGTSKIRDTAELRLRVLHLAQRMADEDVEINIAMGKFGAELIDDGDTILHHCNTGSLAAVDWGTALGVIRMAHTQGKSIHVLVDETRPRLQGARLTAWELEQYGIPYDIITDNSAGYFLQKRLVQKVFFGADRAAGNGDVANKIGTYMLALAAHDNHVPVYAVVPTSTVDLKVGKGEDIPIEERDSLEVLGIQLEGKSIHPSQATARNPAFDITPHRIITGIVTEEGVLYPPFTTGLQKAVKNQSKKVEGKYYL